MKIINLICFSILCFSLSGQEINKTLTYEEVILKYRELDSLSEDAKLIPYGKTDCGESLNLFVISKSKIFDPTHLHNQNKCILFINNGIHPGEPDGIDASLQLANDLLFKPLYKRLLENVIVCIIPVFNIDGSLERSCCSRINQNGPEEYGFRANAKNLDLNRDFIKVDAQNTRSLIKMIRQWDPDVLIDTHVSDGADYQYTMTLIPTQHNKMNSILGSYLKNNLTPSLYEKMKDKNDEMSPYVQTVNETEIPDSGLSAFLETPRFLSGYFSMFNAFSFISESHMLKPYYQRLKSTHNILVSIVELCDAESETIIQLRKKAFIEVQKEKYFKFNWVCDMSKNKNIDFNGYEAKFKPSSITGHQRLFYDRTKPFTKKIPYYDNYIPTDSIPIPQFFIVPQAWENVIRLLDLNGVSIIRNNKDSISNVTATYITSYKTTKEPFEGHYLHYDVKTRSEILKIKINKGDILIPLPQKNMRYALETLIPRAVDSYFCWGFFDSFLQQKEWFSPYVYEDIAEKLLNNNSSLKYDFEKWKSENPTADDYTQLNFIYQHSSEFEKTYNRYPIFYIN